MVEDEMRWLLSRQSGLLKAIPVASRPESASQCKPGIGVSEQCAISPFLFQPIYVSLFEYTLIFEEKKSHNNVVFVTC